MVVRIWTARRGRFRKRLAEAIESELDDWNVRQAHRPLVPCQIGSRTFQATCPDRRLLRSFGETQGPFAAERAAEILRSGSALADTEVSIGRDYDWKSAAAFLAELDARDAARNAPEASGSS